MHHVDRNSGILNAEEKFSADETTRVRRQISSGSSQPRLRSGYCPKRPRWTQRVSSPEICEPPGLAEDPHNQEEGPFGSPESPAPVWRTLTVPASDLVRIHQSPGPIYDPVGRVSDYWRWKSTLYSVGFRPGDLVVNTFAYHLTPAGHMFEEGVSELGGTIIPTGVGNTEAQVELLRHLGVTGYIGTPSFLMAIFKKAEDMGDFEWQKNSSSRSGSSWRKCSRNHCERG